jgi:hypothetical protein
MKAKIEIKRTLNQMRNHLNKLEPFKKNYILKARQAALINNSQAYNLAKTGLKTLIAKQRFLETMVMNFELAVETNEMNKIIGSFIQGINLISMQLHQITSPGDMMNAQEAYDKAIANNVSQFEALQVFLETASASIESMELISDNISDDEIDTLIQNQAADAEDRLSDEIEQKLQDIRNKIGSV